MIIKKSSDYIRQINWYCKIYNISAKELSKGSKVTLEVIYRIFRNENHNISLHNLFALQEYITQKYLNENMQLSVHKKWTKETAIQSEEQ